MGAGPVSSAHPRCKQFESSEMEKPTEEQIRQRAHELREQNHRPDGRDEEFWHQAEKELNDGTTPTDKSETFLE